MIQGILFESDKNSKTATFSPCRKWRYSLWRWWDKSKPYAAFICLNPSTADETNDDPTVRRCIRYSQDWGYGGLCMLNIFAYRATDPKDMKSFGDPIGPENNNVLFDIANNAGIVVAAWGNHGEHMNRGKDVFEILDGVDIYALKFSKAGNPCHPLYLRSDLKPFQI